MGHHICVYIHIHIYTHIYTVVISTVSTTSTIIIIVIITILIVTTVIIVVMELPTEPFGLLSQLHRTGRSPCRYSSEEPALSGSAAGRTPTAGSDPAWPLAWKLEL